MKKVALIVVILFCFASITVLSGRVDAMCGSCGSGGDSVVDKVGDWFATRGKSDSEAQMIVAQRQAKRAAARMQKGVEKQAAGVKSEMGKIFGK